MPTRLYKNTSDKDIDVVGIGEIPAGEQVSVTSDNLQPVMLVNYPMVVDITDISVDTETIETVEDAQIAIEAVNNDVVATEQPTEETISHV